MNRFAKFSWAVTGWTVLNILWGAFVRASGSGAGCGNHWPVCNGKVLPTPENIHTVIEFTHRAMSGIDLLLVLALLIWGWRAYPKGHPVRVGVTGSAAFIIAEALLGAGLVLFGLVKNDSSVLRAVVIALHLLNTFILLAFLALTAWWASGGKAITLKGKGHLPVLLGLGLLGVTIIGMSGAITALGDTLFPARSVADSFAQNNDPSAHFLVRLRIYHPLIAILVSVYTISLANHIRSHFDGASRRVSLLLIGLVIIQLTAGVINVITHAPIPMQIIHLLIADALWIVYTLLAASTLSIEKTLTEEIA